MRTIFAENLARLRQEADISQREAAAALKVSQALLSHYEKGIREPGLDFVVRAAEYYGVSTDWLLCGNGEPVPSHGGANTAGRAAAPSPFARQAEAEIRDTLDIIFDIMRQDYDPGVFCYASIYLSEVLYEIIRHIFRLSPNYDSNLFALSDESFDSGAVVSDLTWVRAQYIISARQCANKRGYLFHCTQTQLEEQYGSAFQSLQRLMHKVGLRVARQNMAECMISSKFFADEHPVSTLDQFIPEQEDSHD